MYPVNVTETAAYQIRHTILELSLPHENHYGTCSSKLTYLLAFIDAKHSSNQRKIMLCFHLTLVKLYPPRLTLERQDNWSCLAGSFIAKTIVRCAPWRDSARRYYNWTKTRKWHVNRVKWLTYFKPLFPPAALVLFNFLRCTRF